MRTTMRKMGKSTYKGALHIHSNYSDGSGSIEEIVEHAREAGLDFIIMSDHNTIDPKGDGWEGWHDGILVIVGVEVSPRIFGHCVAMGVDNCEDYREMTPGEFLKKIKEQGGTAFIAHPLGKTRPPLSIKNAIWTSWDQDGFMGIEIWSYMHDWIEGLNLLNFLQYYNDPHAKITGPDPRILKLWDKLCLTRKTTGLGALDVHAKKIPLTGMKILPYDYLFKTIRTHVRTKTFSGNAKRDIESLLESLTKGCCYVAYDFLADSDGFDFRGITDKGKEIEMGDEITLPKEINLRVSSPRPAKLILLCNGKIITQSTGTSLNHLTRGAGVYRVEGYIGGKPWVFTNPIYVR